MFLFSNIGLSYWYENGAILQSSTHDQMAGCWCHQGIEGQIAYMSNIYVVSSWKKWIFCKQDILFTRCWWLLIEKWHNWNRTPKMSFWCNQLGTTLSSLACPIHTILHTHPRNLPTSTSSRHNSRGSTPGKCSQQLSSVNLPHSYISKIFCTPMQHTCRKLDAKALLFLLNSNYQMAKQFQSVTAFDFDVKTIQASAKIVLLYGPCA